MNRLSRTPTFFALQAEIADVLRADFGPLVTRLTFPMPDDPAEDGAVSEVLDALRADHVS